MSGNIDEVKVVVLSKPREAFLEGRFAADHLIMVSVRVIVPYFAKQVE
jgi:hypothetical protein